MILKRIELSNFQTIKEFKEDFTGNVYLVTGENAMGKSTLLKAIAILLTGKRDEVLTSGEEKGFAKAIIGDDGREYQVELKFTKANPKGTLSITDENGMKTEKVSAFQSIFSYQDFDANQFALWSQTADGRRKQVELIKSLLPEKVQKQIADLDSEIESIFRERGDANSSVKVYSNLLKSKPSFSDEEVKKYSSPIETSKLMEKVSDAATLKEQFKGVEQRYEERKSRLDEIPGDIEKLEEEYQKQIESISAQKEHAKKVYEQTISELEKLEETEKSALKDSRENLALEGKEVEEKQKKADKWMEENKPDDVSDIQEQIDNADEHNAKCTSVAEFVKAKDDLKIAEDSRDELETKLTTKREEREGLIKKSKLPVDGLSFSDEGLFLNGVSFEPGKVATSEEMEVAAKLIIAKNPKTKVFRVARGESLGSDKLKALVEFANKNGYQGFIEEVVRGQNELVVSEYVEK